MKMMRVKEAAKKCKKIQNKQKKEFEIQINNENLIKLKDLFCESIKIATKCQFTLKQKSIG